jgi:hypothetical protein
MVMKLRHIALLAVLGASLASTAFAQQGMGPGSGMGPVPGMGQGAGMGPGGGKGMQFNANKDNTWGYQLMSPEERTVHRDKMRATKSYDECKALQEAHHKAMEVRAKEQGKTLPAPRNNGCDRMKARGYFK